MVVNKKQLKDSHGRIINYMRLAVTDRCNLRCFYCMPEEGVQFLKKHDILSYEEMLRLIAILNPMGIDKVRITGGEPFVRKDIIHFLKTVKQDFDLRSFSITSNATLLHHYMEELPQLFDSMNISLDSLDKERFFQITRRDDFDIVFQNIENLIKTDIDVKINAVVMDGKNIADILPFVEWTRDNNVSVRFIEEMPFNGCRNSDEISTWDHRKIYQYIQEEFKEIIALRNPKSSTSVMYQVKGFKGKFGIIPAFSRTFCGSCNRIRITAKGDLRTCLYSAEGISLLKPMRAGLTEEAMQQLVREAILHKEKDGFEAAQKRLNLDSIYESMTTIGG